LKYVYKLLAKTGEEDEECIHSVRAKLYEDENNSWKERGIGLLKINCNKENKSKVRLGKKKKS